MRNRARALLAQAVEAEFAGFLVRHAEYKTEDGLQRVVSHGHLPEREFDDFEDYWSTTIAAPNIAPNATMASTDVS